MKNISIFSLILALVGAIPGLAREKSAAVDDGRIADSPTWKMANATIESLELDGRRVVRVNAKGDSGVTHKAGLALLEGVEFTTGVIELDLKGKNHRPSFLGVVFNVADETNFEGVYFRPFNFKADEPFRQRAIQYIAWPEHTWDNLRTNQPGRFENAVASVSDPEGWFHARIDVTDQRVNVFVNGTKEPCLTINRLGKSRAKLPVGLFVDVAEGLFANLSVRPASPAER